ncbi:MAG TPA: hypothetical protein VMD30_02930 [Tepidisphaeraceae bacterium]|nr:hypothetical protein [Tepidisphaeraceae bacterium]
MTKFVIGLLVVLGACMIPLAVEFSTGGSDEGTRMLQWFPCLWAALFSFGFLAGCLTRRTAHAAMLAMAGMLLVYCLPLVLPPLAWMNLMAIIENHSGGGPLPAAMGLAVLAAACVSIAILATGRDWRIESGPKMMYGAVCLALVLILSSACFRLGKNLPVLTQVPLNGVHGDVVALRCDGQHGVVVTNARSTITYRDWETSTINSFELSGLTINVYPAITPTSAINRDELLFFPSGASNIAYGGWISDKNCFEFSVTNLATGAKKSFPLPWWREGKYPTWPFFFQWHTHLYLLGEYAATFDITDPLSPRLIPNSTAAPFYPVAIEGTEEQLKLALPPLPGVPPRDRILPALAGSGRSAVLQGDILYSMDWGSPKLSAYRLVSLSDGTATLTRVGDYPSSTYPTLWGSSDIEQIAGENGLVYAVIWSGMVNPQIIVFDSASADPLRPVAYFAAPGIEAICPMADGRALVAGNGLTLLGPPTAH